MLTLFVPIAAAFPVDVTAVPLASLGVDVDAVVLSDGPHVVVSDANGVSEIDPATGAVVAPLASLGARAVLLREVGTSQHVILCASSGLYFDDPVTDDLPTQLSDDPCASLLRTDDGFVAIGGPAVRWTASSTGGYTSANLGLFVAGEPVGAVDGDRVAVAAFGDTALQVNEGAGPTSLPVNAEIGGVAPRGNGWRLGLLDGRLYDLPGTWTNVVEAAGTLATANLDGDGSDDTIVIYPYAGQLGVFPGDGSAEVRVTGPWGARSLAVADLDGDGCEEVVIVDPAAAQLFVVQSAVCGGTAPDADGDGSYPPADCDDTDPNVHPGAPEACDGEDQDCDGEIDELTVTIDAPDRADEGTAPTILAEVGGCTPTSADYTWTATFAGGGDTGANEATCTDAGAQLNCMGPDDGELVLGLVVASSDGAVLGEAAHTVTFVNVPPAIVLPDAWLTYGGVYGSYLWLNLPPDASFTATLTAEDVPTDTVVFAIEGPSYVSLSSAGAFAVDGEDAPATPSAITIVVSDEDGGEVQWPLNLWFAGGYDTGPWWQDTGEPWWNDDSGDGGGGGGGGADLDISCGGCCCWLLGLAVPIALPFRRRLRR